MKAANKTFFSKPILALFLFLIISITLFTCIIFNLNNIVSKRFEHQVSEFIQSFRSKKLTPIMKFITRIGDILGYIIITSVISIFLILKRNVVLLLQILIVIISSAAFNFILKALIDRPRPYGNALVYVNFNSFPSGHAVSSMAFYGFIIYLFFKLNINVFLKLSITIFCTLMIVLIGISRVYLGVHYPTDVLAGYISGFSYLMISILIIKYLEFKNGISLFCKAI
jgi:membrane-associated phospholipid phosphatase